LHYNNIQQPNEYVRAIVAVGDILANYDADGLFPVRTRWLLCNTMHAELFFVWQTGLRFWRENASWHTSFSLLPT